MRRRLIPVIAGAVVAMLASASSGAGSAGQGLPLVGINYSNSEVFGCGEFGGGVVATANPRAIRQQLAAMRAAGIHTVRTLIWDTHDASGQTWGAVSSAGGRLGPTETQNLANFVSDVSHLGFTRLTVEFGPQGANDPIGYPTNSYDPSLFDENWQLIRYVRGIVKQYGGASLDTRFDLISDGAPGDSWTTKTQLEEYIAQMYSNYVDAFGNNDVTVASIIDSNDRSTLANLIDTIRSTGRPLPTWFEVVTYGPDPLGDLRAADAMLTAKGVSQPITLGETYYNDPLSASAVETFATTSSRRLDEVTAWPLVRGSSCANISSAPPYRADRFITALTGSPPGNQITATVGPDRTISLVTPYGQHVTALEAGKFAFAVSDTSRTDNFHITGPRVNVATGLRFRGTRTWTLRLRPGTYHYRSDRSKSHLKGTFAVLLAG